MKLIDVLLRLYPEEFRSRFGRDIRAFHEERIRERRPPWSRIVFDHFTSAVREQAHALGPDIRSAIRSLRSRPAFAAVVILTVALGVGANGAVFSIVNGVLLKPLPYGEADQVLVLTHEPPQWLVAEPQFALYRDRLTTLEAISAYSTGEGNLSTAEMPERIAFASVTRNFFSTLGVRPMLGHGFVEGDDVHRPARAVVLSHGLWARRYAADPAIVGKLITLNGVKRTVVGVMPAGFQYPRPETELWLPICSQRTCASLTTLVPNEADGWANHYLFVIGRMRANTTVDDVRRQMNGLAQGIMRDHPGYFDAKTPLTPRVMSIQEEITGATRPYLVALLGAVGFVLLIVCVNVANLLLARGSGRRREMALRAAIGASRRRLVIQLLTESIVLSLIGGLAGLALAWSGNRVLIAIAPSSLPRLDQIRMDGTVVLYSLALAFVAGILFGVIPAFRQAADTPADALRSSGKGHGHHFGSARTRNVLVVAEIALAMVLLTGAGMLARSLIHLQETEVGFRGEGALTAKVSLSGNAYDNDRSLRFFDGLLPQIRALPGVRSAGAARWLPVVDEGGHWGIVIEGQTPPPGMGPAAVPQEVTPGFFAAMGTPVLTGRDFGDQDRVGAPLVAIVSQSFVRAYLPNEDPLGRRFRLGSSNSPWVSIVGVVADWKARGPTDIPEPSMFFPYAQVGTSGYYVPRSLSLVVRTNGDPLALANPVRAVVRSIDPNVPVSSVRTLDDVLATATANRRFSTTLIMNFAVLALVLASIGIYGVISYSVAERTYEIGVRLALGAERSTVLRLILLGGARLAIAGVGLGLLGAVVLTRWIRSLLVGIPTFDMATIATVATVLAAVALLAAFLPAWRATRIDPTQALRAG